jgi:hypothetical protein
VLTRPSLFTFVSLLFSHSFLASSPTLATPSTRLRRRISTATRSSLSLPPLPKKRAVQWRGAPLRPYTPIHSGEVPSRHRSQAEALPVERALAEATLPRQSPRRSRRLCDANARATFMSICGIASTRLSSSSPGSIGRSCSTKVRGTFPSLLPPPLLPRSHTLAYAPAYAAHVAAALNR